MQNHTIRLSIVLVLCFAVANFVLIWDLNHHNKSNTIQHNNTEVSSDLSIGLINHQAISSQPIPYQRPPTSRPVLLIGVFITGTTPIGVRDAFRNSTASTLPHIKLVFFVGREGDFKEEQAIHGDIVQGTFAENMNNGKTYEWM